MNMERVRRVNHRDIERRQTPQDRPRVLGGGLVVLRFTIEESVCADGYSERHLLVNWAAKSGSCGGDPPEQDPDTGLIPVYDPCGWLDGFTDASLIGKCGTANYMYLRSDCGSRWELNAVPWEEGCG